MSHVMLITIILAIGVSLDSFASMVRNGAMFPNINYKFLFVLALAVGGWQTLSFFLGNSIATLSYFDTVSYDLSVTFDFLATFFLISIGLYMLKKGIHAKPIYESRKNTENHKKILQFAAIQCIKFFLVGIALGFLHIDLPISTLLPIVFINFIALITGVYTGYYFGYEEKSKAYKLGGAIVNIMSVYVFLNFGFL